LLCGFLPSLALPSVLVVEAGAPAAQPPAPHARLAGFGVCWFVLHQCGLKQLLAGPLVLRVRLELHLGHLVCVLLACGHAG
jgi:hypothetical protein